MTDNSSAADEPVQSPNLGTSQGGRSAKSYRWRDQIRDTVRALGPEDTQPMPRIAREPPPTPPDLIELLRALGVALLNSADSAASTTETLQDVAAAYDVDLQAMVMPTGILFRIGLREVDLVSVPNRALRLDQIAGVNSLIGQLLRAAITPTEGLRRLDQLLASKPRFGPWLGVLGQVVLSLGFGLLLNPDLLALPFYAALGAFVGILRMVADKWATLSVALPVVASFLVTVIAVKFVAPFVHDDPIRLVAPALVTFLPGATLTIATIELASDQIVSGASRLVWGVSQLLLLAFGVFIGLSLVGTVDASGATQVGSWAPWLGVFLVGIGYMLFSSAPAGSLLFLWIALFASYAAQVFGAALLDPSLSGFVGGLVIVPLTYWLARFRKSPPAAVMLLPGFWLLLPGALGFRGVSSLATGTISGATELVVTGISIFAVALGVLVGTSVTRDASAVHRTWRIKFRQ
ncbi:MAG: threonine/serine exporter family protein [Nakamurella sp.]